LSNSGASTGWFTRERALVLVLSGVTVILLYLCYVLLLPFLPVLAWALAFGIIARPLHDRIARRVSKPGLAAGLTTALVTLALIAPLILVAQTMFDQGLNAYQQLKGGGFDRFRAVIARNPTLAPVLRRVERQVNVEREVENLGRSIGPRLPGVVTGSLRAGAGVLITIFTLFFFFRDRAAALQVVRSLLPLSHDEVNDLFRIVSDTVYATVYGSVVVAAVQGSMGGIMFWILGLPAPLLWGFVMAVLATIPVLGTFVIWMPAALFLMLEGSVAKGLILIAYGSLAIGLIDNILYPSLVGSRMRLHTLPVFFAVVGGIAAFGISGLVIGPVVMSLTIATLRFWKQRTQRGEPAEKALQS
jgi:predicted PurR-regulated permease PerM